MVDYKSLSDAPLINLLNEEDHRAFTELYLRHSAPMYMYARKLFHDPGDAKDAVQEVLTYIWNKRVDLQITGSVTFYLYCSIRHRLLNTIKRKKNYDRYLNSLSDFIDAGEYITDEHIREKEVLLEIEKTIQALPRKMREIFEMSKISHLSHESIAAKLNISNKTIRNQLSNALNIIRLKLRK